MKKIARYAYIAAMLIVAMLGVPLIFPAKENPYNGKSPEKSSLEIKA